jgi:hypothetical protein
MTILNILNINIIYHNSRRSYLNNYGFLCNYYKLFYFYSNYSDANNLQTSTNSSFRNYFCKLWSLNALVFVPAFQLNQLIFHHISNLFMLILYKIHIPLQLIPNLFFNIIIHTYTSNFLHYPHTSTPSLILLPPQLPLLF